jgi:hypothetical protein
MVMVKFISSASGKDDIEEQMCSDKLKGGH